MLPFRVMLTMRIKPGMGEAFEAEWQRGTDAVTGHPANLGQSLARSTADPDTYYIVSDWVSESGFREFENGTAHIEHRERLHAYRSGATFDTLQLVMQIEGSAARGSREFAANDR